MEANDLRKIFSYFMPLHIESKTSEHSKYLEVILSNGKYVLNSVDANYSFGSLYKVFKKTFENIGIETLNINNCLLLGLGGGSVVNLIQKEHQLFFSITAVEIDPAIIELGVKYFGIDKYVNLDIVNNDALHYVLNAKATYDLVIIDLYINNEVPAVFHTGPFIRALKNLSHHNTILLFNKMLATPKAEDEYNLLVQEISKAYGGMSLLSYNESGVENKIICVNATEKRDRSKYPGNASESPLKIKEKFKKYSPYFVDLWQYLVIIIIMAAAAVFIL